MDRDARAALRSAVRGRVLFDEALARHTTLRVGGPADAVVEAADIADVRAAARLCGERGLPCAPLGGGSNLLVRDGGVRGVLVTTRALRRVERLDATTVEAEAGLSTARLLRFTLDGDLAGMEFLAGVPGSVGGGLVMNAGTYLGEFKDVTTSVASVGTRGDLVVRDAAACGFVYRGSSLPGDEILVSGRFALRRGRREEMEAKVRELRERRRAREPKGLPNAGSFFKNPPGDFAGRLVEAAGLKGCRVGGAAISPVHANWFVNLGGATAGDFLALIAIAREEVKSRFGADLEIEVRIIGEDSPP